VDRLLAATFLAEREHFWFKGFRQFITPMIARGVKGVSRPRILDCGCGTGSNLMLLRGYGDAYGFDLTPLGLQFARESGGHRVARASITQIPFASSAFDLLTSFDVLQCLTEDQETHALSELARLLKPGGALVLNVAALELLRGSHSILAEEVRRYTPRLLRAALTRAGFTVERLTFTNFSLFPLMLALRTVQRAAGLTSPEETEREIALPAKPVNTLFTGLLTLEARAVRMINMPIGSSLLCLARKNDR
jgi:SAM-dependent methyltransferase